MSRRTAGLISPLLFTLALLAFGSSIALGGGPPSASGGTSYGMVASEEPVKPEKDSAKSKPESEKPAVPAKADESWANHWPRA